MAVNYRAYPEYKRSGIEWLGETPKSWKPIKFGITNSSAELGGNYLAGEGEEGMPVIKMGNLGRGVVNLSKVERLPQHENFDSKHLLKKGDFLFNTRNSLDLVGKVSMWRGELDHAVYNSNVLRITFHDHFVDSTAFMNYLFNSSLGLSQLRLIAKGTTSVAAIYYKELTCLVFSLPPTDEQHKIANFLDHETAKIDTLIEKQQQLIKLLKEKRQAVISHAVTKGLNPNAPMRDSGVEWLGEVPEHWEMLKGSYIGRLFGSETVFDSDICDEGDIRFIKVSTLDLDGFQLGCSEFYLNSQIGKSYKTKNNYIVFPKRGAAIFTNKVNIVKVDSLIDPNLMGWKIGNKANLEFIAYLLKLRGLGDIADVSTVPQINNKHIESIKFPIPPLTEQDNIVHFLTDKLYWFSHLIKSAEHAIELMQERRTALISAAVTGKIDVRNWQAPEPSNTNNKEVAA